METTRHFTATVYVVNDGATALHEHDRLGITIPPGGHLDRDELPHEAGKREVEEELGQEPTLVDEAPDVPAPDGFALPTPRYQLCYDIDVHEDGSVGHQHVDHVYFATVPSRRIDPGPDEALPAAWDWYTPDELRAAPGLDADTTRIAIEAIRAAE